MAAPQVRYGVAEEAAGAVGSPRVIVIRDHIAGVEAAVSPSEGGELTSLRWTEGGLPVPRAMVRVTENSLNVKKGLVMLAAGAEWEWVVELRPEISNGATIIPGRK